MPLLGFEPRRPQGQQILSLPCLPDFTIAAKRGVSCVYTGAVVHRTANPSAPVGGCTLLDATRGIGLGGRFPLGYLAIPWVLAKLVRLPLERRVGFAPTTGYTMFGMLCSL